MQKRDPNDMDDAELSAAIKAAAPPPGADPDAELAFIAAAIINPKVLDRARLERADFTLPDAARVFGMLEFSASTGTPLQETSELRDLTKGRASDARTARLARDRILAARARREAGDMLASAGGAQAFNPKTLRDMAHRLSELGSRLEDASGENLRSYHSIAQEVGKEAIEADPLKSTGEPTGVPLDRITGGFKRGEYWIIAGATQLGKSWLANLMQLGWAQQHPGDKGLLVSTEMGEQAMAARSLATLAGVPLDRILRRDLTPDQEARMRAAMKSFPGNVLLASMGGSSIDRVLRAARSVEGLAVLVVDLASGLRGRTASASGFDQLSEISKSFQAAAKELNIQVVGVVQLKKSWYESTDRAGRDSVLGAIKGTGAFYEDPDVVVSVTGGGQADKIVLGVEKNRRTGKLGKLAVFRGENGEMREVKP